MCVYAVLMRHTGPVLLFPWHIGAGHVGRLVELGRLITTATGRDVRLCRAGTVEMLDDFSFTADRPRIVSAHDDYLTVPDVDSAWSQSGLYNPSRVRRDVYRDLALLRKLEPALVVTHMQPTAVLAARVAGIPLLSVADGDFLDRSPWAWMPWAAGTGLRVAPFPRARPALNQIANELGLPELRDEVDLLWGDRTLVPSAASLDPAPVPPAEVAPAVHCGPLIWSDHNVPVALTPGLRTVYLGLGSGELWPQGIDNTLTQVAEALDICVFRSTPNGAADNTDHLKHVEFGTLSQLVAGTDVTITHGGHSTIHAALAAARPVVVAPFMSENENNGRAFVESNGAGICLWHTEVSSERLWYRDRQQVTHERAPLTADVLTAALREVLDDGVYQVRAMAVARELKRAAEDQADRIQQVVDDCVAG